MDFSRNLRFSGTSGCKSRKGRRPIGANNGGGTSPAVCWRQSSDRFHWWDMEPVVSGFLSSVHSRDECLKFCHDMLSMFGATSSVKLIRNCCHCILEPFIFGRLNMGEMPCVFFITQYFIEYGKCVQCFWNYLLFDILPVSTGISQVHIIVCNAQV